jgi:hypothetical protein
MVYWDPNQLEQVFLNVMKNSIYEKIGYTVIIVVPLLPIRP